MSERAARTALAAVAAFAVGYLLPGTLQLPVLVYDPVARTVTFTRAVSGVSMRYFGDLLVACAASLGAAAVVSRLEVYQVYTWYTSRRTPLAVAAGAALSLVALDVLFYLSRLLAAL